MRFGVVLFYPHDANCLCTKFVEDHQSFLQRAPSCHIKLGFYYLFKNINCALPFGKPLKVSKWNTVRRM
ncbi:jg8799 [Pararge aegeria aegeria]|uniref:Jg8799 protein n=1 Tax=Pararge aegeria aegeria TaxID=348720 RepID=A0A8S4S3V0_9NEOP|nr:jg8799 [Pararge aegeria aegeria]